MNFDFSDEAKELGDQARKLLAEKAGIPRHVFLESINDSVLGSMYTKYKTPMLTNLTFDQVTFTPKLLLKDMDLGLGAARAYGVAMPAAAATRESVARMVGRGYEDIDFASLLVAPGGWLPRFWSSRHRIA